MKIKMICVGKTMKPFLKDGEQTYVKRLGHYSSFEKIEIPELKNAKKLSQSQIKQQEGRLILNQIKPGETMVLLDEHGKHYSSVEFSKYLQKKFNSGGKGLAFIIGGAYGFSDEVYAKASGKISLSKMTFSHQMVRLFFLEQLYRGFTILKGEPYHHE
ncbi:MAG: 23S rRNA (pseudouridine(1915)-N(3))-methyltransferase RlmH [Crocinitomicaceae bacterium]|nr:23S rRNA (pseudouridine(1915)-N(3))-methyltransferase RlmH [Crocinitomicaceae bacterium]MDG1775984.1 23S rRNA (pseudouridine(1915)-N(3))-methyltransferase RlmH [Crocinitomicaceae bacterium]